MPLGPFQIVFFDEEENFQIGPPPPPISPIPPTIDHFPCSLETLREPIRLPNLAVVAPSGWIYLNLNTSTGSPVDLAAQAWVTTIIRAEDRYSVGLDAVPIDSACEPNLIFIGPPE